MENNSYVYRHRRLDTNEIFYVGMGMETNFKRAFRNKNRSEFWKNIVTKTEYSVEILAKNLSWEDAQELEAFLIFLYGRKDLSNGILVNHTDGYGGINNPSLEIRKKMSRGRKGKESIWKNKQLPESTKDLMKKNHADFSGGKHPRARKVLEVETGVLYECIKDISDKYGINHRTLCAKLNGAKGYKPDSRFQLC